MKKSMITIITLMLLSGQCAYSQTLKEKYNEQTRISTQNTKKEVIKIQTEKQEEPPQKARLERLKDRK
nr:MAG TPA: hypothetical protein [Inoviridae sp.]